MTAAVDDLPPDARCEGPCRQPFDGRTAYGDVTSEWGDDPYGLDPTRSDHDLTTGHVVENFRCRDCLTQETP